MTDIVYTPSSTVERFMLSDRRFKAIMGPVGSGKSVGCCFEIIRRAHLQEPGIDGIRRTRCLVVRETVRQLVDTTIKTFLDWFPPGEFGTFFRSTKTYLFKTHNVQCEIMFRGLDDPDDVANLNSLEVTFAWINECRDIPKEIVDAMSKRVGRYPSPKDRPDHIPLDQWPTYRGIWADTNPPTIDTYWYYVFEHIDPKDGVSEWDNGWDIYKQPSGRSPEAENTQHLPGGQSEYYDTTGRDEEYIRVFIDGQYGHSLAGKPVFRKFSPETHISKHSLRPIFSEYAPLVVGMDLGLTPAAVVGQLDPLGRALVLAEAVSDDMGIQRFCARVLRPLLASRFPGYPVLVACDPAGRQRSQNDERSAIEIIKAAGLRVIPARTNAIVARLNAVDGYLMGMLDGGPMFLMDPSCKQLKAALIGGYRFRMRTNGEVDDTAPEKNKHSHIADALQYLMLHITALGGEAVVRSKPIERAPVSAVGWT